MSIFGTAGPDAAVQINNKFVVEIDGIQLGAFEECEVNESEYTTGETRTGADSLQKREFSGVKNPREITLKYSLKEAGVPDLLPFNEWHQKGSADRRSGSVIAQDRDGNNIYAHQFTGGWIKKFMPPAHNANAENDPLQFEITISCANVDWVNLS